MFEALVIAFVIATTQPAPGNSEPFTPSADVEQQVIVYKDDFCSMVNCDGIVDYDFSTYHEDLASGKLK